MGWIIDLADGGGGGTNQRVIVPPDSPFTNAAAVAAFYGIQANRNTWLRNSTEESIDGAILTVIVVDDNTGFPDAGSGVNTYQWGGIDQAGSYNITNWVIYQGLNSAEIKQLYESNPDTNAFTDDLESKLEDLNLIVQITHTPSDTTPINTQVNESLRINLVNSSAVVNLPPSPEVGDILRIQSLSNIGSNNLTVQGATINVLKVDGNVDTDTSVITAQSRQLDFTFTLGGWFLYNL